MRLFSVLLLLGCNLAVAQEPTTNLALGRPVIATGATWPGFPPGFLTDGNRATFSHPNTGVQNGYYFQIDLGDTFVFDRMVLHNRGDGCCPERLSNYRLQVFADNNGTPGAQMWSGDIRADGSNSGVGGTDIVRAEHGTGMFAGRFVRIANLAGMPYNPQLAELEVYGAPRPRIRFFTPAEGNIGTGATTTLSWRVEDFITLSIDQGIGPLTAANGAVEIAPAATTTYTLTARNPGGAATASVTVGVNEPVLAPYINEFLADNEASIEDEDGEHEDWIEIANPNAFSLNLAGYYLTDTIAAKTKWRFPSVAVPPGGFRLIFASGKNRVDPGGPIHTNFRLAKSDGYLALIAPDGMTILQEFAPAPLQFSDKSYGRDSSGALKYFRPPTPDAPNGAGFDGVVADTRFSVGRGIFTASQTVAITTETPAPIIRYTTNGTVPTLTNGATYTAPLTIATTTVLRAAAFKEGFIPTNVDTHTYLFPSQVADGLTAATAAADRPLLLPGLTDLPSLSIVTQSTGAINDATETPISFELLNPDQSAGFQANAGVSYYGGAFTNFAKKNFRIYFRGTYGTPKLEHAGLFAGFARGIAPATTFDQLELRSGSHDMVDRGFYMSNTFTDDTMLDMGNLNPHSRYVHLYLNGAYHGMYHLRERWSAKMLSNYLGGPDTSYEAINGNYNAGGWADPGTVYDGDGAAWARIKSLRSDYAALRPYLDLPHFIDYMLLWMFGNAEDEYRAVGPTIPGSGFKWMINDADGWLSASAWDGNSNNTARSNPPPGRRPGDGPGSLFSTLLTQAHPDYRALLADRIHRHLVMPGGALTPPLNAARLTERTSQVQRAIVAECARWRYRTPATWAGARDLIFNSWFPARTGEVLNQFRAAGFYPPLDAPVFNQQGGSVPNGFALIITAPVGTTIHYTIGGRDPRLPGGAVAPEASTGANVVLTQNTIVKARTLSGTQWSAINEALFLVNDALPAGALAITELNYHPLNDAAEEFIELANLSGEAINLRGVQFASGIEFAFPDNREVPLAPGERILLVENRLAFETRYGLGLPIAGVYRGNLDNGGESVVITTAQGGILFGVTYDDLDGWPAEADGAGRSLVLANRTAGANPHDPLNWRASTTGGGTPGVTDTTSFAGGDLLHYALTAPHPLAAPTLIRKEDGTLEFTHRRNLAADDIAYRVEVSADASAWVPGNATLHVQTIHPNGTATITWRLAPEAGEQKFVRLRVTLR